MTFSCKLEGKLGLSVPALIMSPVAIVMNGVSDSRDPSTVLGPLGSLTSSMYLVAIGLVD